jgi:hypothetical protein
MDIRFEDGKEYLAKHKASGGVNRVACQWGELLTEPFELGIPLLDIGNLSEFDFVELPDNKTLFDMLKGAKHENR